MHFLRHLMMLLSAFLIGKKKVRYFVGYLAKRKKPSFYLKLGFFRWCGRWDLNPHVIDTRTSNVPVCRFQHFRITISNYTIKFPIVNMIFLCLPSKNYMKNGAQRDLTLPDHYEVFYCLVIGFSHFQHPYSGKRRVEPLKYPCFVILLTQLTAFPPAKCGKLGGKCEILLV